MRHINLPGCLNLRDVGGYPTDDGALTAWGRLYRSGELCRLDPLSSEELVGVCGIRQVIDLRTAEEVASSTTFLPEPCRHLNLSLLPAFRPHWIRPPDQRPEATAGRYLEMLELGVPTIVAVLDRLRHAASDPVLVHCALGRDRTGIVIAMILDVLGVPEEVIAGDYALSDGVIDDGERARAETIHRLFDLLRARYGSSAALLGAAGASSELLSDVRAALLEPQQSAV
jgi:protein-tyrosine phosphatase